MLARIKAETTKGEVTFISEEDFAQSLRKKHGNLIFEVQQEAIHWAIGVGRLHSYWQMGNIVYVKVVDEKDDPYHHYTPTSHTSILGNKTWVSDCCGSGNCGSGGDCESCKH